MFSCCWCSVLILALYAAVSVCLSLVSGSFSPERQPNAVSAGTGTKPVVEGFTFNLRVGAVGRWGQTWAPSSHRLQLLPLLSVASLPVVLRGVCDAVMRQAAAVICVLTDVLEAVAA